VNTVAGKKEKRKGKKKNRGFACSVEVVYEEEKKGFRECGGRTAEFTWKVPPQRGGYKVSATVKGSRQPPTREGAGRRKIKLSRRTCKVPMSKRGIRGHNAKKRRWAKAVGTSGGLSPCRLRRTTHLKRGRVIRDSVRLQAWGRGAVFPSR